jgi:FAD-dependent halogenase
MRTAHVIVNNSMGILGNHRHVLCLADMQRRRGFDISIMTDGPGLFTELCRKEDIPVVMMPSLKAEDGKAPPMTASAVQEAASQLEASRVELIHCHSTISAQVAISSGNRLEIPCVFTLHGMTDPFVQLLNAGQLADMRFTTIVVSRAGFDDLRKNGMPETDLYYVPNGTKTFPDAQDQEVPRLCSYDLMLVGSLVFNKGIDIAIRAMLELRERRGSSCPVLSIYGDGEQRDYFKEMVATLGLNDIVKFCGVQFGILDNCPRSAILIIPSRSETGPLVALEAMSRGMPIVASDVGEVADMLPHQRYGRIVPVNSITGLADAIDATLSDIYNGRFDPNLLIKRHKARYSSEKMARRIEIIYDKVVAKGREAFNLGDSALERPGCARSKRSSSACKKMRRVSCLITIPDSISWRGKGVTMGVEDVDVVVIGGGPGGSTLAALVAMQKHRVVVLEKEKFPRWAIGESLLPSTVHGVCRLTGVLDEISRAGFTLKRGGTQRWGASPEPWTFSFSLSPKMTGETSFAYQVERSKFDKILLDHARKLGADVREQCAVTGIIGDEERVRGVSYAGPDGVVHEIRARYVVDASGNRSVLYKEAGGERKYSEFFRSLALFGYFEGGKRLPPPNSGNILSCAFDSGWFWYIPLRPTLTSVGAVVRREMASKIQGDPDKALRALIAECPTISDYLKDARRVTEGEYGQLRVRKDYSYVNTRFWRPGLILVGDAACFVDPIFSSGVHLATYSALLAARSINSAMAGVVSEEVAFREFELRYRREFSAYYEFLVAFYDLHVSESSYFWSAKKVTKNTSSELESFVELVGGVSSGEAALVEADALAKRFKDRSSEFAGAVDNLVADPDQSMVNVFKSTVIRQAMREGTQVQARALLGEAVLEAPLFEGGLVPSGDGYFWAEPT